MGGEFGSSLAHLDSPIFALTSSSSSVTSPLRPLPSGGPSHRGSPRRRHARRTPQRHNPNSGTRTPPPENGDADYEIVSAKDGHKPPLPPLNSEILETDRSFAAIADSLMQDSTVIENATSVESVGSAQQAHDYGSPKKSKLDEFARSEIRSPLEDPAVDSDCLSLPQKQSARSAADLVTRILRQNEVLHGKSQAIEKMREKLLSYEPGDWIVETGDMTREDFDIPDMTTLLVIGPSGAGKSTLINNMIRVLNKKTCGFDRAQVFDGKGNGSYFLQEYIISEKAKAICMFDSRGLSENDTAEDLEMLKTWVEDGVCHGQAAWRKSDNSMIREALEGRGRHGHYNIAKKREINFVIFVLNAVTLYQMKEEGDLVSQEHLIRLYKSPYISFKDDMPAIAMTHGDLLPPSDRLQTRLFIGELFGISPADQVFDISGMITGRRVNKGEEDPLVDTVLLDLLEFSLERADRNLPFKAVSLLNRKVFGRLSGLYSELGPGTRVALLLILICWVCCLMLFTLSKFGIIFEAQEPDLKNPLWVYRLWHL